MRFVAKDFKKDPEIPEYYIARDTICITQQLNLEIDFRLLPETTDLQTCIDFLNQVMENFAENERTAQNKIVSDYHNVYNENWADSEDDEDYEFPQLNKKQFRENLTLIEISLIDDKSVEFIYAENGMFDGHILTAYSDDGKTFSYSSMCG